MRQCRPRLCEQARESNGAIGDPEPRSCVATRPPIAWRSPAFPNRSDTCDDMSLRNDALRSESGARRCLRFDRPGMAAKTAALHRPGA